MELAAIALADYPDDLLGYLADPARGIVRKSEFIPTIAKCCAFMDAQWDRQRAEQEFRDREARRRLPPVSEALRPTKARPEIVAKFRSLSAAISQRGNGPDDKLRTKAEVQQMSQVWLDSCAASPMTGLKLSQSAKSRVMQKN